MRKYEINMAIYTYANARIITKVHERIKARNGLPIKNNALFNLYVLLVINRVRDSTVVVVR